MPLLEGRGRWQCTMGWWDKRVEKTRVHPKLYPEMIKQVSFVELLGNEGKKMPVLVSSSFRNLAHKGASYVTEKDVQEEMRRNYRTHQEGGNLCRTA